MAIRVRDGSSFAVSVSAGPGKRWRRSFRTYDEAQEWEAQALSAIAAGLVPSEPRRASTPRSLQPTIGDAYNKTVESRWSAIRDQEGTQARARMTISLLGGPYTPVRDVDSGRILVVVRELRKKHSPGTTNRYLSGLSAVLRTAKDLGWIPEVPKIPWQQESQGRQREFTDSELHEIGEALHSTCGCLAWEFFCWLQSTGCRVGESLAIEHRDLRHCDQSVWLRPETTKSGQGRRVFCAVGVWLAITRSAAAAKAIGSSRVFPIPEGKWHEMWNKAKALTSFSADPEAVPHALRHTYICRAVRAGIPVPTISKMVGHSNINTTMRYVHTNDQDVATASRSIPNALTNSAH